jgi:hypothetical protein
VPGLPTLRAEPSSIAALMFSTCVLSTAWIGIEPYLSTSGRSASR